MPATASRSGSSPAQVLANIERGKVEPVYILFGPDSAVADEIIAALRRKLVQPGFEAFDFESGHADDVDVAVALQHVNQPPVGSKRRLVVIRDLSRLHREHCRELCAGLAKTPDFCTVVTTSPYEKWLAPAFSTAGLARFVVNLYQPFPADLAALVRRWARERKLDIDPQATAMLLDITGTDTALLRGELDKMATAFEPGRQVTAADVRRLAASSREFTIKDYAKRAVAREAGRALRALRQLADWGEEPVRLIYALMNELLTQVGAVVGDTEDAKSERVLINRKLQRLYEINRLIFSGHREPYMLLETFTVCLGCPGTRASDARNPGLPRNPQTEFRIPEGTLALGAREYCRLHADAPQPQFCLRRQRPAAARRTAANAG